MVVAQKLWEVVEQDEKDTQSAAIQPVDGFGQLGVSQEGREELEESREKVGKHRPALLLRSQGENATEEHTMRHDLQPGVGETGSLK